MTKNRKYVIFIIALFISFQFCSCAGQKRVDGSSDEAMKASIDEICKDLPEEEVTLFVNAIAKIGLQAAFAGKSQEEIRAIFDGKTSDEVIEMGKDFKG